MTGPPPHYTSTQRPHQQSGRKEPTQCWWIYQNTEALLPHRQCYLDPDQPCVRDFWRFLLVRRGAHGGSAPHAPQHTCKVCEIVTLNGVKVATDVSLLFIFLFFEGLGGTCVIKVMGFQNHPRCITVDLGSSSNGHHSWAGRTGDFQDVKRWQLNMMYKKLSLQVHLNFSSFATEKKKKNPAH